jgi:putative ABC transport system ATP-binding protein
MLATRTNGDRPAVASQPGPPVIDCRGVHKRYHLAEETVHALRGVDLVIPEPGFYAIMGASGSGKSTLMHLLAALDTPGEGSVRIAGRELAQLSDSELTLFRRRQIGIVFQQFNLIPTLTAIQNVELPGMLAGEDAGTLRARAKELMAALGVGHREGHRPDALSGGEQQRVAIARALLFRPPLILADEPTGNLDSKSSDRLWRLLGDVAREQKTTIVMVTHEPAAAVHCRRVYVLQDGRVKGVMEVEGLDVGGVAARYQHLVAAS